MCVCVYIFPFVLYGCEIWSLTLKEECRLNILRRKSNWNDDILRRNCLLHDAIEGQMTELKGVGRRRTQVLDELRNRRYCTLKEEAQDPKRRIRQFNSNIRKKYRSSIRPWTC